MIASGSEDEETASTPEVQVVAAPETYVVGQSSSLIATVTGTGKGKVGYQWYKVTGSGETEKAEAIKVLQNTSTLQAKPQLVNMYIT